MRMARSSSSIASLFISWSVFTTDAFFEGWLSVEMIIVSITPSLLSLPVLMTRPLLELVNGARL
jgi:hypothetical protein